LPNVFGRWSRPNYNSAVATFCHNISRGLPVQIHDPAAELTLVHIDQVVDSFVRAMRNKALPLDADGNVTVLPQYKTTVGVLAGLIQAIHDGRAIEKEDATQAAFFHALVDTYKSLAPMERPSASS